MNNVWEMFTPANTGTQVDQSIANTSNGCFPYKVEPCTTPILSLLNTTDLTGSVTWHYRTVGATGQAVDTGIGDTVAKPLQMVTKCTK